MLAEPVERGAPHEPDALAPARREPAPANRSLEIAGLVLLSAVAACLLLTNLGNQYLWQDEAQTALLARTILEHGVPHGHDGRNHFSQELGVEYGTDGVWKWHTWLSFYAMAGSFALLGPTTFAARLPFALFGLLTVWLTGVAGRVLWRDSRSAWLSAALLTLSVPFLILSRQGRYYALASLLCLAGLVLYRRLGRGRRAAAVGLFVVATLLFHTHYVYAATLLASLLLHASWLDRGRLRQTLWISIAVTGCALPWIGWVSSIQLSEQKTAAFLELGDTLGQAAHYLRLLLEVLLANGLFLLIPLLLLAVRRWSPDRLPAETREARDATALLGIHIGVSILLLALLSPLVYVRYLAPLLPPLFLLVGHWLARLSRLQPALAAAVIVAFVAFGSLRDFVGELRHDYDGPIEGIVDFLNQHADPDDTVGIVYGDLPLKFYTDLRIVGGLTGEDVNAEGPADWIILRHHTVAPVSRRVRRALGRQLTEGVYRPHTLDAPETAFENREDPREHRFLTDPTKRRVVIWERRS